MNTDTLKAQINGQLAANRSGLEWARTYLKSSQLAETRQALIKNRIYLKRVNRALSVNPAAAIFGESQVGKSYMVDCLLTSDTDVLNVYNGQGVPTGFIESINPLGGGKESTGLICRFTAHKVWENPDFPVRVEMLSPIDIVMVLIDTYFNDVNNLQLPKQDEIKAEIEHLNKRFANSSVCQEVITEDEIFELREYFMLSVLQKGESFREALIDCRYFETLANVIHRIDPENWKNVFSFLWNNQPQLTKVFAILIDCLKRMDFSQTVYIKMEAVLRASGTLLHVDRIYELFGLTERTDDKGRVASIVAASEPDMEVLTSSGKVISQIEKSKFCAVAMEVAFTIANEDNVRNSRIVKQKPFLEFLDILDFPGARSRKMFDADIIEESQACEMVLRGKVAYLFNKYSQQYLISNLLFCHHAEQSNVSTLSSLLKGWVEKTVGTTPEERTEFMEIAKVAPLFIIGTKFNIDLKRTPDDSKGSDVDKKQALTYRWTKRFGNLLNLIAPSPSNNWLNQWTSAQPFNNVYLLRSYEYSCQDGLFQGYQERPDGVNWKLIYKTDKDGNQVLQGDTMIAPGYVPFFAQLKSTFLENDFVQQHFENPEKSWIEVIGYPENDNSWHACDGSAWIIKNLTDSGKNMTAVRESQMSRIIHNTFDDLIRVLFEFYHDDNSDEELRKQLDLAGSINLTLDALFGKDKYFFSDFISALTIEEEHLHDVVLDTINAISVIDETDLGVLFAIRANANIDPNLSTDENRRRLREVYSCQSDHALEEKLAPLNITVDDIINPPKILNFSHLIAEAVGKEWISTRLNSERYKEFVRRGLRINLLESLLMNYKVLYTDTVKMSDRIARRIHPFVSAASGSLDKMADMLADISAEMINTFVNSVGAAYFEKETWEDIESTIKHNHFDLSIDMSEYNAISFDSDQVKEDLPMVFNAFDNVDKILNEVPINLSLLEHFSNYEEYRNWIQRMKISFLATTGIPKYNIDMNNALRQVLVDKIVNQDSLKQLISSNHQISSLTTLQK